MSMTRKHDNGPGRIAAIYALTGALWILLSDRIVAVLYHDWETLTRISMYKGWAFILLTSLLLYLLIRRYADRISGSERLLLDKNRELTETKEQLQQQLAENIVRQQDLFEAHQTLKAIVGASPVAIVALDRQGIVTLWNNSAAKLFGWSEDEIIGHPYPLTPPGESVAVCRNIERALGGEMFTDVECRRLRKNGELLEVSLSASPLRRSGGEIVGVIVIAADITERIRAADSLRRSEENYRLLFVSNPHPMWVFDRETMAFLEVNAAAVSHYGWSRDEFLAMTIRDIRPPEDVSALLDATRRVESGFDNAGIWRHRKKDGTIIHVEIVTHTLEFNGHAAKLVLSNDVTDRVRAREEILQLNAELEDRVKQRTAELQAANSELESFSYSVSHDLRAPLRHLDGYCSLLREEHAAQLDDAGRHCLERITFAARKMDGLITDMLQLARVSREEISHRVVELSDLVAEICDELQQAQPDRVVTVSIVPHVRVCGDLHLLKLAMENLLGNAWKYTGKTPAPVIEFGTMESDDGAVYFVRDNGVGFDMTYAGRLFGPFQRLHTTDEFEGTGIGLATVQRIIHRHGGRIWAEGNEGQGATFFFTLPIGCDALRQDGGSCSGGKS
jgi:PAS domain S-box-containing protein